MTVVSYATLVALGLVALFASGWALQKFARDRGSSGSASSPGHLRARAHAAAERRSLWTDIAIGAVLFIIYGCAVAAERTPHAHHDDASIFGN